MSSNSRDPVGLTSTCWPGGAKYHESAGGGEGPCISVNLSWWGPSNRELEVPRFKRDKVYNWLQKGQEKGILSFSLLVKVLYRFYKPWEEDDQADAA
ncbi:hypothetical protein Tco_0466389 [Tanacetum coccineum]